LDANHCQIEKTTIGLINQTFVVTHQALSKRYILQHLNTSIFKNPIAISANIKFASACILAVDENYPVIKTNQTINGEDYFIDDQNYFWRLIDFIENTTTIPEVYLFICIPEYFPKILFFGRKKRCIGQK
jgi:hypothetical protein